MANKLFEILSGIIEGGYESETLASTDMVISYAESCGENISHEDAARIIETRKKWAFDVENGNGEWERMRREAAAALE